MQPEWKYAGTFLTLGVVVFVGSYSTIAWLPGVWFGTAFVIVGVSYLFQTTGLFGKRPDGTRNRLVTVCLLPYLVMVNLVWRLQILTHREPAYHEINEHLIVSRRLSAAEFPENVTLICDLTCEFCDPLTIRKHPGYRSLPILDGCGVSGEKLMELVKELLPSKSGRLLIHCALGHGRTGMVASAWLIAHGDAKSVDEAIGILKSFRPGISLRKWQRIAVEQFVELWKGSE